MTRQILKLGREAYEAIRDYIPRAIESESIDEVFCTADIVLSDNVILKSYYNGLTIDLGARRIVLEADEFECIVIR